MKEQLGIYCMSIIIHKNVNYSCWTIAITTFIHLCESIICKQSQRLFCWGGYLYLLVISFLDILPSLLTDNSGWYVCRRVCRHVWRRVCRPFCASNIEHNLGDFCQAQLRLQLKLQFEAYHPLPIHPDK